MDFRSLKEKQRNVREGFSEDLGLRVHRALSWLEKSEQCSGDLDSTFIFLWIAFNAAYSQDTELLRHTEAESFSLFISKLVELDEEKAFYDLIWSEFSSSIRLLLDNKFVFQPFWEFHNGKLTEDEWKNKFSKAKAKANIALSNRQTDVLISVVLQRLYTLRNQLIHGGATWNSSANRSQIKDGVAFLSKLVPILINVMMENPREIWGSANYPVITI
ncbi:hypothetical protein [Neptunicella sp.]|uniref:hypothetical protein n=1 Tax=Neptunicella sp. TaxID=2125986 RepID=UPI003F68BF04